MRVLVISGLPWNKNNSFGSTFSSLFEGMQDVEFLNIYTGYGLPDNNLKVDSLQITELSLLKNLLNPRKYISLVEVNNTPDKKEKVSKEQSKVDKVRKFNNRIVFWGRCFIWKIGRWKTKELYDKVTAFKPDIIFSILYYNPYLNNLMLYCHKITKAPIAIYSTDDVYSLRQFSLSPFFWIERLIVRKNIKRLVQCSRFCYTISKEQKEDYQKYFGKEFKLLTKGDDFSEEVEIKKVNRPILIVYTGALYWGRFSSLSLLMEAIQEYNNGEEKFSLKVYSNSVLKNKEKEVLNRCTYTHWMGGRPASEMKKVQNEADILLHLESLKLADSLAVRHSFSTKLVEYFKSGRAILAIGKRRVASCSYLIENECGYVADSKKDLVRFLDAVYQSPDKLEKYARNALMIGKERHQIDIIQTKLRNDLDRVIQESKD